MLRRFKSFRQGSSGDLSTVDFQDNWDYSGMMFGQETRSLEMSQLAAAITNCIERHNKHGLSDQDIRVVLNTLSKREKAWIADESPLFPAGLTTNDDSIGAQKNLLNRKKAKEKLASRITLALKDGAKRDLVIDQILLDEDIKQVLDQLYACDPNWKNHVRYKKDRKTGFNNAVWYERRVLVRF